MVCMILPLRSLLLIFFLLTPEIALAHSPIKGIGDFFNGMLHPVLVPAQVLVILALGLWFGQNKPAENQVSIFAYLFAVITGLIATSLSPEYDVSIILLLGATAVGLLIISNMILPKPVYILSGIILGFIIGFDSAQDGLGAKAKWVALFGSGVGIYFLLLYAMALSESLSKKAWQNIAVRVIASWISANALMVLALNFAAGS